MHRRKGAHPHLDPRLGLRLGSISGEADAALLRQVGAVGQQFGQHLEPRHNVGRRTLDARHRLQQPIDPAQDLQLSLVVRDQVQVARPGFARMVEQKLNHLDGELLGLGVAPGQSFEE